MTALSALERHLEQPVAEPDDARSAIGRNPEIALVVECDVVGARDRRDHLFRETGEVGRGVHCGVAADEQHVPRECERRGVVPVFRDLDDVTIAVGVTRIDLRGALFADLAAVGVVGAGDVDLARLEAWLDILAAVHLRRSDGVGGEAGVDEGLFGREAEHLAHAVDDEWHPLAGAVELTVGGKGTCAGDLSCRGIAGELRDVQAAARQQPLVDALRPGGGTFREPVERHVLVEVIEAFVITHIRGHVAGRTDDHIGAFMLEPAHRGVLHRGVERRGRVDFDDPAEPVRLVLVPGGAGIEARVDVLPHASGLLVDEPVAAVGCAEARRSEVAVEVLLAREHGAPRGGSARAVAECAENELACGVGSGREKSGTGGRARHDEGGRGGDAAVVGAADRVGPGTARAGAGEFDDRHSVRHHRCASLRVRLLGCGGGREHDVLVRVLVIRDEVTLARGRLEDVDVVDVVAELLRLRIRRLFGRVEGVGCREERVTPTDHRGPLIALGNHELVGGCRNRGDGSERQSALSSGCRGAPVEGGCDDDRGRSRSRARKQGASRERGSRDVPEVPVVARVGHRVEARIRALQMAGDRTALAGGMALHRQRAPQRKGQ